MQNLYRPCLWYALALRRPLLDIGLFSTLLFQWCIVISMSGSGLKMVGEHFCSVKYVVLKSFSSFFKGAREITRLDITMQPLIQDIFSQIIDSFPYFPERFCDFSCMRFPFKTKSVISCKQFLVRNAKNGSEYLKLI